MDISALRSRAASGDATAQYHLYLQLRDQFPDEALGWLRRSAEQDFAPALYEAGTAALAGPAPDVDQGLKLISGAAEAGFAAADYHLACLLVHGHGVAADSRAALKHLRRAVEARDPSALYAAAMMFSRADVAGAAEWAFVLFQTAAAMGYPMAFEATARRLATGLGTDADPAAAAFWASMANRSPYPLLADSLSRTPNVRADSDRAEAIAGSIEARLEALPDLEWPPDWSSEPEMLCDAPRILTVPGFLNDDECSHLVNAARPRLRRSSVVDPASGEPTRHPTRTSHDGTIGWRYQDIPYFLINRRYALAAGMPASHGEDMSVIHYTSGEEYKLHHDYFETGSEDERVQQHAGGQRVISMFTYLNEVPAGGETEFPALGIRIQPRRGLAVQFDNCLADGRPDVRTKHASRPVESGEKWLAVKWFRERPVPATTDVAND